MRAVVIIYAFKRNGKKVIFVIIGRREGKCEKSSRPEADGAYAYITQILLYIYAFIQKSKTRLRLLIKQKSLV